MEAETVQAETGLQLGGGECRVWCTLMEEHLCTLSLKPLTETGVWRKHSILLCVWMWQASS